MDLGWALAQTYCGASVLRGISGPPEVEMLERSGISRCQECEAAVTNGKPLPVIAPRPTPQAHGMPVRVRSDGQDGYEEPSDRDNF